VEEAEASSVSGAPSTGVFHRDSPDDIIDESTSKLICPVCQEGNDPGSGFCHLCGSKLQNTGESEEPSGWLPEANTIVVELPVSSNSGLISDEFKTVVSDQYQPSQIENRNRPQPQIARDKSFSQEPSEPAGSPRALVSCPTCSRPTIVGGAFCVNCGSQLSVDKTILMASAVPSVNARLELVMEGGQTGDTYEIKSETAIGRNKGDIVFPHDGHMSGRHARIVRSGHKFTLVDDNSANGTFVRIKEPVELKSGDMFLIGGQLFRFKI